MQSNKLSIIIPSRSGQPYLQRTIDDLLIKAEGEIEVIVVEDGVWPNPPLKSDPRVLQIHHGTHFESRGMKQSIMSGIAISNGEFIMKTDEHTMFDQGFDTKLKADCEDNWVVIPRRWRLDGDEWKLTKDMGDTRLPVDYMYLTYPYEVPFDKVSGLHGQKWDERTRERWDILIDETPTSQGSCYFMKRIHWDNVIKEFDVDRFGSFTMEAQEIGNKTWFAGGKVMVNKKTWYGHMHKGKQGKRYGFSNAQYDSLKRQNEKGRLAGIQYVFEPEFEALFNRFPDMPGWPKNWKEQLIIDEKTDYSHTEGYSGL